MITVTDVNNYLGELGMELPSIIVAAIVEKANSIEACMVGAGYSDADKTLIALYLAGMLAMSSGARMVRSQSAPSGASRSYQYGPMYRQIRASLSLLDTSGCATDLIPAEPNAGAALFVGMGNKAR
jgi:hypothetical protein